MLVRLAAVLCALAGALPAHAQAEPELVPSFPARRARPASLREIRDRIEPGWARPPRERAPGARERLRDLPKLKRERPLVSARARTWFVSGFFNDRVTEKLPDTNWTPSFAASTGHDDTIDFLARAPLLELEAAPHPRVSILVEYARFIHTGGVTYRTWVHAEPAATLTNGGSFANPDHMTTGLLNADGHGRLEWLQASLAARALIEEDSFIEDFPVRQTLDLLLGYEQLRLWATSHDAYISFVHPDIPSFIPSGVRLPGVLGDYHAAWRGPHAGLRHEIRLPAGFALTTLFLGSPLMQFKGEGAEYLNQYYYRDRAWGHAVHLRVGASWSRGPLGLELGWQKLSFRARRGTRDYTYLSGVAEPPDSLKRSDIDLSGLLAGLHLFF